MTDNRLHYWAALTVFSVVSLSSMTNSFEGSDDWIREQKWAVSVASISLGIALLSFFFRLLMTEMFSSKYMEHAAAFIVLVFWCAGLRAITDRDNLFAVGTEGVLVNVNLFFTSWMAFIMAMMLFADTFPAMLLGDRISMFTKHWIGFGTASFIAMANAVWYWRENCESTGDSPMCHRDLFAFVLGAVSGFFALVFFALQHERLEQTVSIVLCAGWCFGIAYLTFDDGPAMYVGSFYFSVWFSFLFLFWMAVHSVVAMYNGMKGTDEAPATEDAKGVNEETDKHNEEDQEKEEVVQEGNV